MLSTVEALMTRQPLVVSTTTPIEECAEIVVRYGVRHLPVVEADRTLTGMLTDFLVFQQGRFVGPEQEKWVYHEHQGPSRRAGDIAIQPAVVTPKTRLREVVVMLADSRHDSVVVIDPDQRPVGILTEHDIVRHAGRILPEGTPISTIASRPILTVERDVPAREALDLMLRHQVRHLIVLSDGMLYGVLSLRDVVRVHEPGAEDLRADQVISGTLVHKAIDQTSTCAAARTMEEWKVGCLPVVDAQDRPFAIVTRRDIMRALMLVLNGD